MRSSQWACRPQRRKNLWLVIPPSVCILVHILATHLAPISGLILAKVTRKHNFILELRTEWGWVVSTAFGSPFFRHNYRAPRSTTVLPCHTNIWNGLIDWRIILLQYLHSFSVDLAKPKAWRVTVFFGLLSFAFCNAF